MNQCNELVGKNESHKFAASRSSISRNRSRDGRYFPFKQGYLSVMTLRVGEEGIQMTVDGKHITSFAFREVLLLSLLEFERLISCILSLLLVFHLCFMMLLEFGAMAY